MSRTYSELSRLSTFQERYEYLKLSNRVGIETYGSERYVNQVFYQSREWRQIRTKIIVRDNGCDMGLEGYPCGYGSVVHHINPITAEQIAAGDPIIFDLENLVLCSFDTHEMIHFGGDTSYRPELVERKPNDQCPWLTT